MLYDLNIAWSPGMPLSDLERTLTFAKHLGYDVVAINHTISGPIPTQPGPIPNPIPQLTPPHPSYPGGSSSTTTNLSTTAPSVLPPSSRSNAASNLPTTLRRVTLVITDPSTTNYRLPDYTRSYDLLAVRPTTEKAFSWACLQTTEPPALISLDLSTHLGWHIHHRTAMAAVGRGSRFEVCYSQVLSPSPTGMDAQRARANFIGNLQSLLRATKGRGIVISSEARNALGLRAPADVVNLLAVWGLGPEKGMAGMREGARGVVVNEGVKRRGFRGVVDIVRPAEGGEQQQQHGLKRKSGEGENKGGAGESAAGMSKKQLKRMRKEAREREKQDQGQEKASS